MRSMSMVVDIPSVRSVRVNFPISSALQTSPRTDDPRLQCVVEHHVDVMFFYKLFIDDRAVLQQLHPLRMLHACTAATRSSKVITGVRL